MSDFEMQVVEAAGAVGIDAAAARKLALELRRRLGGGRHWVRRAKEPKITLADINAGLKSGLSVAEIARAHRVSRTTIYAHLAARKSTGTPRT